MANQEPIYVVNLFRLGPAGLEAEREILWDTFLARDRETMHIVVDWQLLKEVRTQLEKGELTKESAKRVLGAYYEQGPAYALKEVGLRVRVSSRYIMEEEEARRLHKDEGLEL